MRAIRWFFLATGLGLGGLGGLALLGNGCAGSGPNRLPEDEAAIQTVGPASPSPADAAAALPSKEARPSAPTSAARPAQAPAAPVPATAPAPIEGADPPTPAARARPDLAALEASPFTPLTLQGVRGGQLAFDLEGSVEDVVAMLLDYDHANGRRAWAATYQTLSGDGETVRARWQFRGKMGVAPTVVLELKARREPSGSARIRYRVVEKAFGLAAFFGDWRVEAVAQVPGRSRLTARVFIDSGLPFVNASHEDIESGLREDARLMREWMEVRLAAPGRDSR